MKYKTYKTVDKQIEYLKENKNIIVDEEDRHYLEDRNYISLVNPYKIFFASGRNNEGKLVYKKQSNFKELLSIIKIDEDYSVRIYERIGSFKKRFKNIIFTEICSKYVNKNDLHCLMYINEIRDFLLGVGDIPIFCENYKFIYGKQREEFRKKDDIYFINRKRDVLLHIYQL